MAFKIFLDANMLLDFTLKREGGDDAQKIIDTSHDHVLSALLSKIDDIEDALQYYTALQFKIDYFISRDKKLKSVAAAVLPVYSPQEFLEELIS